MRRPVETVVELSRQWGLRLKQSRLRDSALGRGIVDAILWPSDLQHVRGSYRTTFGKFPRLLRPRTFNENVQRSKLFRRHRRQSRFADKLAVRDHVARIAGRECLVRLFWSGTDLREARSASLPEKIVVKANHASGTNLIVTDVSALDWQGAHALTQRWLADDYSERHAEWPYRWISPRLLIEEYLGDEAGAPPRDFKFFCFHGRAEFVQVDEGRFAVHTRRFYDRDFRPLPFALRLPASPELHLRPTCFEEMIRLAECLSAGEPFLRVDLYDLGRPVFGELTLHPGAGLLRFDPPEWDDRIGALF